MNYPKIVDGQIEVVENFEEGCMDPLAFYSIAFINAEGNLAFWGAETDEDFIALANQLSGECDTVEEAIAYSKEKGNLDGYPGGKNISNSELLELECDILVPAAMEDQITDENAGNIKAKLIVEGANGPTSANADKILNDKGIIVVPDILANAGGVTVSYFEWVQNRMGYFWTEERVNRRADRVMKSAFDVVFEAGKKHIVSLRTAAYIVAIDKVATTQKFRGVF